MKAAIIALLFSGGVAPAATVISSIWNVSAIVPDNNPAGWSDTRTITSPTIEITDVRIYLEISGGYNGDLYAYVTHDSGFSVLLNRVGRTSGNPDGSLTGGMAATFTSGTGPDIHNSANFHGDFTPDGRTASPRLVTNADPRTALLSDFIGLDPNGEWTLFVADLSPLGQSTVVSWGVIITTNVTVVPEPTAFLGTGLLAVLAMWKRRR